MENLERENELDPLSSSFCPGNPQFTVNAQHSLEGSDQQTVQPVAVQREAFIDTEMGLGGLMGHMYEHEVWGTFLPTERAPSSPRCRKVNSEARFHSQQPTPPRTVDWRYLSQLYYVSINMFVGGGERER